MANDLTTLKRLPSEGKVGSPRVDLEDAFRKLQPFLQLGYSFNKSCLLAQVPYTTLIVYYNDDEDFRIKVERERTLIGVKARRNLAHRINKSITRTAKDGSIIDNLTDRDVEASLKWLETQEKDDWSTRTEVKDVTNDPNEEGILLLREIIIQIRKDARKKLDDSSKGNTKVISD